MVYFNSLRPSDAYSKLTIIGSDNGLSPDRRPLEINFSEILIKIHTFSFKKIHLKLSSGKWRPFCLGLNELSFLLFKDSRSVILVYLRGTFFWFPVFIPFFVYITKVCLIFLWNTLVMLSTLCSHISETWLSNETSKFRITGPLRVHRWNKVGNSSMPWCRYGHQNNWLVKMSLTSEIYSRSFRWVFVKLMDTLRLGTKWPQLDRHFQNHLLVLWKLFYFD